ncbi:hypothetical protein LTR91_027086, partial [Friedmanniomyces endolithicus]
VGAGRDVRVQEHVFPAGVDVVREGVADGADDGVASVGWRGVGCEAVFAAAEGLDG